MTQCLPGHSPFVRHICADGAAHVSAHAELVPLVVRPSVAQHTCP
jgi:hypothetical protein